MSGGREFDVLVIGGGPAGSTAAFRAARHGMSVGLIEREQHPRFHIGESFLPRQTALLKDLGLLEGALKLPHVPKYGASFAMAHDADSTDFWFPYGPGGEEPFAFSLERAPYDRFLLESARSAGVEVFDRTSVKSIDTLAPGDVALTTTAGTLRARVLLDASGQGTVVARHLGTRRTLPDLCRVAYFQHFTGVDRREGRIGGHPIIVMCEEGWFWMIPLDERRTSIGLVMAHEIGKSIGIPADRMLAWGVSRSPFVGGRMRAAAGPETNYVCADFSYTCRPYAGPGYFLVGDAATFVDPIFSTGVCMGMMSGGKAADAAVASLREPRAAERLGHEYARFVEGSSSTFFGLVRAYYGHGFREMFLNGSGPLQVHTAILSLLAGHVFPRPVFSLRWRRSLFDLLLRIHDRRPLVPPREGYSLVENKATPRAVARRRAPRVRVAAGAPQ